MKILILLSRVPYPLEKGDKLRAFHQLKLLSENNKIILCCLNAAKLHKKALEILTPFCIEIKIIQLNKVAILFNIFKGIFSKKPFQVSYFYHKKAQKIIDRIIEKHLPNHIYCQLVRTSEYAKKYTIIKKTLDYMDALSTGIERRIENAPFFLKLFLKSEAQRLKKYEMEIFSKFQNKTIISEQDKKLIPHPQREIIKVIPNGVDTNFFEPFKRKKDFDLLFTGNMNYPPNIECAHYLVNEILPVLKKKIPQIRLLISGANPSFTVKMLASKNVHVSGWVEDIRESYARAKIFVAPMQTGTGLQNKLLEAMAMKLPCITSPLTNNALGAEKGKEILIAKNPIEYVSYIEQLLSDNSFLNFIAENGYVFVKGNYNWNVTVKNLENTFLNSV